MPPLLAGLLAMAALVLLPGLLVVRAPWTAVPPLSLGFWVLSAWWPSLPGSGRSRLVSAALLGFGLLAILRLLPKHEVPPPPGWAPPSPPPAPPPRPGLPPPALRQAPSLLVLGAALALLLPLPLWHHAPGRGLAYQTTMARLLVWHGGIPVSAEPLLPLAPFGAHGPAVATLAADLSHLSGLDPAGAVLIVVVASGALVLLGLFGLLAIRYPASVAGLGALAGLAVAPWPGLVRPWGEGEGLLALAFALPAAALLVGHATRSSAAAAGFLLAAGALAQPLLAATVLVLASVVAARRRPDGGRARLVLASIVALVLAAPGLLPLSRALSPREAKAVLTSVRPEEAVAFAAALGLVALVPVALRRLPAPRSLAGRIATAVLGAVAALLLVARVHGWIRSGQLPEPMRLGLSRVAGSTGLLGVVCAPDPARDWVPALAAALAAMAALLLVARVHGWIGSGQLPPSLRSALSRAAGATGLGDTVCAPEVARDWVPALAGRAAGEPGPWVPPVYADEWAARPRRDCALRLETFLGP